MSASLAGLDGFLRVGDLAVRVVLSPGRRTVGLTIERDAAVTAAAPPDIDVDTLTRIVRSRRRWIYRKLDERIDLAAERPLRRYISGEGFAYLGRSYRLLLVDTAGAPVQLIAGRFRLRRDLVASAPLHLVQWYAAAGTRWLPARGEQWAARMGVTIDSLKVRSLGYRWGSCTPDGSVNIHWATMQLPVDLIDYVLVHELAHLEHHDHSPAFWRSLERVIPEYETRRTRLIREGARLWLP